MQENWSIIYQISDLKVQPSLLFNNQVNYTISGGAIISVTAIGDRLFLGMQNFDFTQISICPVCPKWQAQIYLNQI